MRNKSWGVLVLAGAFAVGLAGCKPSAPAGPDLAARSAAAHKAADQFAALAKAAPNASPPRQTDPAVAPLLDAVLNTSDLLGKPTPPYEKIEAMDDWMLSTVHVGQVYLFAGAGVTDPSQGVSPQAEAMAEQNVATYAPEMGRYLDAQLTLTGILDSMLEAEMAANPAAANSPEGAAGLVKIRAGTTTTLQSALAILATPGVTDDWRRARMAILMTDAAPAAKLLTADQRAQLKSTAAAVSDQSTDAALKASLATFETTVAP